MEREGFRLCSLKDIVKLRIIEMMSKKSRRFSLFDQGPILIKEAILCTPSNPPVTRLIKNSPFLEPYIKFIPDQGIIIEPYKLVNKKDLFRNDERTFQERLVGELGKTNFFPTINQIRRSLENAIEFPIEEKPCFGRFVATEDFKENKLVYSIFGVHLDLYEESLVRSGIKGIRIYPEFVEGMKIFEKDFARQMVYGRDETADICLHSILPFEDTLYYIFGIKDKEL
ncbi:Uncharacterised protein [uncultured archaeon]|nr:Uncharacterised protein [uncultured archaeon]